MHSFFPSFDGPTICMRCGGKVYKVKDDQVLPYEFVPTWRRLLRASIWSTFKVFVLWLIAGFIVAKPEEGNVLWVQISIFGAAGAAFGFSLPWLQAIVAERNHHVNEPHTPRTPSVGESLVTVFFLLPVVAAVTVAFIFLFPAIVDSHSNSMGTLGRGLCGSFAGFITLSTTTRELFRRGRKPPPDGKVWHLGEKPS